MAATERLAAFEAHSTQMREELQALKVELQELRSGSQMPSTQTTSNDLKCERFFRPIDFHGFCANYLYSELKLIEIVALGCCRGMTREITGCFLTYE